jgi:hypothetical protein
MYRFVDLNDSYWTNPDGSEDAQCAILDTRTNRFLECDGSHVLGGIDEVREAAGERGVSLVPFGFFERKQGGAEMAPLTLEAIVAAEMSLAANNVTPPYVLRATRASIDAVIGALPKRGPRAVVREIPDDLDLEESEVYMGRVRDTCLIAVDRAAADGFYISGERTLPGLLITPSAKPSGAA